MSDESEQEKKDRIIMEEMNRFYYSVTPFGSLDVRAGIEILEEFGFNNSGDSLAEALQEYQDFTGSTDLNKVDITALAYDYCLQHARNAIENLIGFDIENDASFSVYGNFMCSSFNYDEDDKKALIEAIAELDEDKINQVFDSDIIKAFLDNVEIKREDIKRE